jgi:septal ring factor EnvC (AmiA/AmiB activator)
MLTFTHRQSWKSFDAVSTILKVHCTDTVATQRIVNDLESPLKLFQKQLGVLCSHVQACTTELERNRELQVARQVEITDEMKLLGEKIARNTVTLAELNSKVSLLQQKQNDLSNQEKHLQNRVREEQNKRQDAVTDMNPGVGFVGGLITGRYKRMIPGHSLINGLISVCTRDLESCQRQIHQTREEYSRAEGEKNHIQNETSTLNQQSARLQTEKDTLSREEISLTRKLNYVSRLNTNLLNCVTGLKLKTTALQKRFLCVQDEAELLEPAEWNNNLAPEFRRRLSEFDALIWTGSGSLVSFKLME